MTDNERKQLFLDEQTKKIKKALKKNKMDKALHHARAYVMIGQAGYSQTGLMENWLAGRVRPDDMTDTFAFSFETDARANYLLAYGQAPENFDQLTSFIEFSMLELLVHGQVTDQ